MRNVTVTTVLNKDVVRASDKCRHYLNRFRMLAWGVRTKWTWAETVSCFYEVCNTVTWLRYFSIFGIRDHEIYFICILRVKRMSNFLWQRSQLFLTLIHVSKIYRMHYFFCLRRRIVSSQQREKNYLHKSRTVVRVPATRKMFSRAAQNNLSSLLLVAGLHLQTKCIAFLYSSNTVPRSCYFV
jgi:hypothetical protein